MKKILVILNAELPALHVINTAIGQAKNTRSFLHFVLMKDGLALQEYDYPFPNDLSLTSNRLTGKTIAEENTILVESNVSMLINMCKTENLQFIIDPNRALSLENLVEYSIFSDYILADAGEDMQQYYMDELLVHACCPVLLASRTVEHPQSIILTYDARSSSVHALKMFAYLFPEFTSLPAILFHVTEGERNIPAEENIRTLLSVHYPGIEVKTYSGNTREELNNFIKSVPAPLVIMGSFGRNAVSRFFRKSIASSLLEQRNASIFIGHD